MKADDGIIKKILKNELFKIVDSFKQLIDEKTLNVKKSLIKTKERAVKKTFFLSLMLTGLIIMIVGVGVFLETYTGFPKGVSLIIWGLIIFMIAIAFDSLKIK